VHVQNLASKSVLQSAGHTDNFHSLHCRKELIIEDNCHRNWMFILLLYVWKIIVTQSSSFEACEFSSGKTPSTVFQPEAKT